ncbi:MAG: response regulator [Bacteroidota bacterium]|jgi:two-component system invasion response regulator UvrY
MITTTSGVRQWNPLNEPMLTLPQDIKLLVVDDHVIIRRGLKFFLESHFGIRSFHEADTCIAVREMALAFDVSHIILDLQLHDGNSVEIISDLLEQHPLLRILVYTMSPEEVFKTRLLKMGVAGFLNKQADEQTVVSIMTDFFTGKLQNSDYDRDDKENKDPFNILSERELTVMTYLLKGEGIKEISGRLNLKSSTVATFKARIFNKLSINNIIDLKNLVELYRGKK